MAEIQDHLPSYVHFVVFLAITILSNFQLQRYCRHTSVKHFIENVGKAVGRIMTTMKHRMDGHNIGMWDVQINAAIAGSEMTSCEFTDLSPFYLLNSQESVVTVDYDLIESLRKYLGEGNQAIVLQEQHEAALTVYKDDRQERCANHNAGIEIIRVNSSIESDCFHPEHRARLRHRSFHQMGINIDPSHGFTLNMYQNDKQGLCADSDSGIEAIRVNSSIESDCIPTEHRARLKNRSFRRMGVNIDPSYGFACSSSSVEASRLRNSVESIRSQD